MAKKKKVLLVHNPTAGAAQNDEQKLVDIVRQAGYTCEYQSTKRLIKKVIRDNDCDFIAIAGGDGTVRKIARQLLQRRVLDKRIPIALFPLGTANNIARALDVIDDPSVLVNEWKDASIKKIDVGKIYGVKGHDFFLEGFGYGVFPELVMAMKKKDTSRDPEESKAIALTLLHDIIMKYKARTCEIVAGDKKYEGKYLLVEIMNIRSIGPNLHLTPDADPGDGMFDVALIDESQREALAFAVQCRLEGREEPASFAVIKANAVEVQWTGSHLHLDDEIVANKKNKLVRLELREGLLDFMITKSHATT